MTTESTFKDEYHYNSVKQMINDLGWRRLADRGRDIRLTLFYKIVNHEANVTSEGILILAKGTMKSHPHSKCMHIGLIVYFID